MDKSRGRPVEYCPPDETFPVVRTIRITTECTEIDDGAVHPQQIIIVIDGEEVGIGQLVDNWRATAGGGNG